MKFAKLLLLSAVVGLTACKKDDKKDENTFYGAGGLCSGSVVSAINNIEGHKFGFATMSSWELSSVKSDCSTVRSFLGGASCKAVNVSNGDTTWITYGRVSSTCASVDSQITSNANPTLPTAPSTSPTTGSFYSGDNCPQEIVNASNNLTIGLVGLSYATESELKKMSEQCVKFDDLMKYKYCYAEKMSGGYRMTISYNDHTTECSSVKSKLTALASTANSDSAYVKDAPKGVIFTVRNSAVLRNAIRYGSYFIGGDSTSNDLKSNRCVFSGQSTDFPIQGISYTWTVKNSVSSYLTLTNETGSMILICDKASGSYGSWTMGELRQSLTGILDISAKK